MGLAEEFAAFEKAVRANKLVLPTTPARVCSDSGAVHKSDVSVARSDGTVSEQFYKWQLVHGLVNTGRIPADNIGAELSVPRGSRGSSDLYIDLVIFSDDKWAQLYDDLKAGKASVDWDDLINLMVGCGEIKDDKADNIESTLSRQLLPALKATTGAYSLGFYYNAGHLVLISRQTTSEGVFEERLDPTKQGTSGSRVAQLNAYVPDNWETFPALDRILSRGTPLGVSRANRSFGELDVISSRSQRPVESALEAINRKLDSASVGADIGYRIVVETLAVKVYDEKRSEDAGATLDFYIDPSERPSGSAIRGDAAKFRDRMKQLHEDARPEYPSILDDSVITWASPAHLAVIGEVVNGFQDISLRRSAQSDLYQVVFYNFAGPLSKVAHAQFLTPLPLIDFMVDIANPQPSEDVFDPTMGIADFLAVTFRRGQELGTPIDDANLFGVDNDSSMVMLAGLNMLLNGDGAAQLQHVPDTGSLDHKVVVESATGNVTSAELDPTQHAHGRWEFDPGSRLITKKFDLVLTNPPFGEGRALKFDDPHGGARNREIASLYEVADGVTGSQVDKGILFLENAVSVLKPGGRFGIVLSRSISSVGDYKFARDWLLKNVRVVATFDLPPDIFAETGVPTTVIFGYRPPSEDRLRELQDNDYEIFTREIQRVGISKQTRQRVTYLVDKYVVDPVTGRVEHDPATGEPVIDQEFSEVGEDFKTWANRQESELQRAFL